MDTAKITNMVMTTTTTIDWARATACDPTTFRPLITTTSTTAKTLAQASLDPAMAELR